MIQKRSNAYFQAWRDANRDKVNAANKRWYDKNRQKKIAYQMLPERVAYRKQWLVEHPEKNKIYSARYDSINRSKRKLYRDTHREYRYEYSKDWQERNRDKMKVYYLRHHLLRRKDNPDYQAHAFMYRSVRRALINSGTTKDKHTIQYLNYTGSDLRKHLEGSGKKISENHIDHKVPLRWFDKYHTKEAWELENLHLLSAKENEKKKALYTSDVLLALRLIGR
jgi:hypothetical protein